MARKLPTTGENMFLRIKRIRNEYETRTGQPSINLSVGEPDGIPTAATRSAAAVACMSTERGMHVYQDNGAPDGFAQALLGHHLPGDLVGKEGLAALPLPGIKPMIGLLPLACGAGRSDARAPAVTGTTKPGYPVIRTWSEDLGCRYADWPLYADRAFRPRLSDAPSDVDLALLNYPNNPTGTAMTADGWHEICRWAVENGVRLVNDAAYAGLVHTEHVALAEVASTYADLEWMELFSASKSHNATGWRVGVAFGHADFIADMAMVKGNTDSGFAAPMAVGVTRSIAEDQAGLAAIRELYGKRIDILLGLLEPTLRLATTPEAGFFSFWHAPTRAFGESLASADDYNTLMVERCGLVGVPYTGFDGEYIRYAVCFPLEDEKVQESVRAALAEAAPEYA